jgi:hypothetical protein
MADVAGLDAEGEVADGIPVGRFLALERLCRALRDRGNTRIGYNPAVAEACEELRKLDRKVKCGDGPAQASGGDGSMPGV